MPEQDAIEEKFDIRRRKILSAMLSEAVFDGWTDDALLRAAKAAGLTSDEIARGDLHLLFPKGVHDVLDFWAMEADAAMEASYEAADPPPQKIREKVTFLIRVRIEYLIPHREAARRAAATLALPHYNKLAAKQTWRTSDAIWRTLGDTSTDFNHYTKRTTLSGVYLSTLARWFADEGDAESEEPYPDTWAFLDDRIENVMQFEKVKAKAKRPSHDGVIDFLAKLRYGGGR